MYYLYTSGLPIQYKTEKDFYGLEKTLEKTREIDNAARI